MVNNSPDRPVSLQTGREFAYDFFDGVGEVVSEDRQRAALDNPRLVDNYAEAKIHILVRFRHKGFDEEFVALFQRKFNISGLDSQRDVRLRGFWECHFKRIGDVRSEVHPGIGRAYGDQQAVLVDSVKAIQYGQVRVFPSVVWFDTAERIYSVLPEALYYSASKSGFVLLSTGIGDELKVGIGGPSGVCDIPELVHQVVKSAPEILDNVSEDRREMRRRLVDSTDIMNQLFRVRIVLGADFIGVGVEETPNFAIEFTDVLCGPLDLDVNTTEPILGSERKLVSHGHPQEKA
jgi:hypothetical protein